MIRTLATAPRRQPDASASAWVAWVCARHDVEPCVCAGALSLLAALRHQQRRGESARDAMPPYLEAATCLRVAYKWHVDQPSSVFFYALKRECDGSPSSSPSSSPLTPHPPPSPPSCDCDECRCLDGCEARSAVWLGREMWLLDALAWRVGTIIGAASESRPHDSVGDQMTTTTKASSPRGNVTPQGGKGEDGALGPERHSTGRGDRLDDRTGAGGTGPSRADAGPVLKRRRRSDRHKDRGIRRKECDNLSSSSIKAKAGPGSKARARPTDGEQSSRVGTLHRDPAVGL